MKRSDMIKILRDSFLEHMNCQCCSTDEELYSKVLQILEKAGMLPPNCKLHEPGIFHVNESHKWEPEDEQ
jgi:hypothetical protein